MILCPAELSHYKLHCKLHVMVTDNSAIAVSLARSTARKGGGINETNYHYSIIAPPILVAKSNWQKRRGGIMSSEYGTTTTVVVQCINTGICMLPIYTWDSSSHYIMYQLTLCGIKRCIYICSIATA